MFLNAILCNIDGANARNDILDQLNEINLTRDNIFFSPKQIMDSIKWKHRNLTLKRDWNLHDSSAQCNLYKEAHSISTSAKKY